MHVKKSNQPQITKVGQTKDDITVDYIGPDHQPYSFKIAISDLEWAVEPDDTLENIDQTIYRLCVRDYQKRKKTKCLEAAKKKAMKFITTIYYRGSTIPIRVTEIDRGTLRWQFQWNGKWENGLVSYGYAAAVLGRSIYDENGLTKNAKDTIEERTQYYIDKIMKEKKLSRYLKSRKRH